MYPFMPASYEELRCIGFNPQLNRLGLVWIKQTSGYDGGICTNGSQEYVSFFLSYDNVATWLPQGTTSFPLYDIPGAKPLQYAVSVVIQPVTKFCSVNNLPLVKAILSWNVPPAGPFTIPIRGNVIETRIQIEGFKFIVDFPNLLKAGEVKLPPAIAEMVSEPATVKLQPPKALTAAELKKEYANSKVPAHRFLQKAIPQAVLNPSKLSSMSGGFAKHQRQYRLRATRVHRSRRGHRFAGRAGGNVGNQAPIGLSRKSLHRRQQRVRRVLDRLGKRLAMGRHSLGDRL